MRLYCRLGGRNGVVSWGINEQTECAKTSRLRSPAFSASFTSTAKAADALGMVESIWRDKSNVCATRKQCEHRRVEERLINTHRHRTQTGASKGCSQGAKLRSTTESSRNADVGVNRGTNI
jgi:hypothetical protein